jgi:hypothetical protein
MKEAAIWQLPSMFFFSAVPRVGRRQLLGEKAEQVGALLNERNRNRVISFFFGASSQN